MISERGREKKKKQWPSQIIRIAAVIIKSKIISNLRFGIDNADQQNSK